MKRNILDVGLLCLSSVNSQASLAWLSNLTHRKNTSTFSSQNGKINVFIIMEFQKYLIHFLSLKYKNPTSKYEGMRDIAIS